MAFSEDLAFGKTGERIAWLSLLESPKTRQVMDVRNDAYFQERDIDFLQLAINNRIYKIEVKTDRQAHATGNIAFETKSNSNEGCLARSEADYIYYYLENTGEVIIINLPVLKGCLGNLKPEEIKMGDNARGYLIKIQDLLDLRIAVKRGTRNGN